MFENYQNQKTNACFSVISYIVGNTAKHNSSLEGDSQRENFIVRTEEKQMSKSECMTKIERNINITVTQTGKI